MIKNLNPIIQRELDYGNYAKTGKNQIQVMLLAIDNGLDIDAFDIVLIATVSGFEFIQTDVVRNSMSLTIPLVIVPDVVVTENDKKVLKEIQLLFKTANGKRSGSMGAILVRFHKLKQTNNITAENCYLAARIYLEDESSDHVLTCERFFYTGPWSNRESKLMSILENMEIDDSENFLIPGII